MSVLHQIHLPLDLNKINKWKPNRLSILFSGGCDSRRAAVDGTFQVSSAGYAAVSARRRRPWASRFSLHSQNGRPTTRRRNAQEKQSSFSDELQCDRRPTTKTRRCEIFQKFYLFFLNLNELNDSTAAARPLFFSLAFPCALGINFLREKVRYRSSRIISRNMRRLRLLLAGHTSLSWTQTCSIEWTSPSVNGPQRETPAISILDNQILKCLASSTELWPYLAASSQEWLSGAVLFALKKLIVSPMKSDFFLQLWSW